MPLPPHTPRVTRGRQVAWWGGGVPPLSKRAGGAGGPPEGPPPAGGAAAPRSGMGGTTSACCCTSRTGRGGGGVIHAPGTERRVQGLVPVDREPSCRAPPRCLRLRHRRLPLRLRLLGGGGLGRLHVAFACPVAVQPALEAGLRGPRLRGLRGLLSGREFAFLDPEGRPQGGPHAVRAVATSD